MSDRSKRGMGEVFQRGKRWWIRYYYNGHDYRESSHSTKQADAVDLLKTRITGIRSGAHITPTKAKIKFQDAAKLVEDDYTVNQRRSLADVKRRVKLHLTPWFGHRRLGAIDKAEVVRYIAMRLEAGASNASINRELAILKRAFRLADLQRPAFSSLREANARQGFVERDQITSVLRHLPEALAPVILFGYITGWRVDSEVLTLEWPNVDFVAGEVRLDPGTTKNSEGRTFPLTTDLRTLLRQQKAVSDALKATGTICPWVFHRAGAQIKSFRGAWQEACKLAGCPGRMVHDLRRTAVRNLVRAGVPQTVAMKMTGHLTDSVFRRYDIASPDDMRVAAERLNMLPPLDVQHPDRDAAAESTSATA